MMLLLFGEFSRCLHACLLRNAHGLWPGDTCSLVMHWQYASISRGSKSIFDKLEKAGIDPEQYISFYALRSYDRIDHTKAQDEAAKAAGIDPKEREALGAATEDYPTIGQFVRNAEPDFVRGTEGSSDQGQPIDVENINIPSKSQAVDLRVQDEVYAKQSDRTKDTLASCAMLGGGDILAEPWLDGKDHNATHDPAAEDAERQSYVTEELYIHTKVLIADDRM